MAKKKTTSIKLSPADYEPLLVAISSRAVDTCLMGARCLALLKDPRAFGLLMQLSREENASVRLETCRSLAQLRDRRAIDRLCNMLADSETSVRDAAFTALDKVCSDEPLIAVEHGFATQFEDVCRRALELLIREIKKSKSKLPTEKVDQLVAQSINDSHESVRNEAFKFVLNSGFNGGEDATLRYLLGSVHSDVRREVLNEIMAQEKQLWAETMILEMLQDADPAVRSDAFDYLKKKNKKTQNIGWLSAAIASTRIDIRKLACQQLVKTSTAEALDILATAIHDPEHEVRELVLKSLIQRRATESLVAALDSKYVGVQLAAASALAEMGDKRSLPVFVEAVNQPWPQESEEKQKLWVSIVTTSLAAIGSLGDPEPLPRVVELCSDKDSSVRLEAAKSLRWLINEDSVATVKPLMQVEDIRFHAAFACALYGDSVAQQLVLNTQVENPLAFGDRLHVVIAMRGSAELQLVQMLDEKNNIPQPNAALLVMLCRDWLDHDGTPRRIIAALAARDARLRLIAANALQSFGDDDAMATLMANLFNDRSDDDPYEIKPDVIRQVAEALVFGRPPFQCQVVSHLDSLVEKKQDKWNLGWNQISGRYQEELKRAKKDASSRKLAVPETAAESLNQLAFGIYVGLARELGGYHFSSGHPRFGWSINQVRQAALRRLLALAQSEKTFLKSTISVVTHACGDPRVEVRTTAFEILEKLGVEDRVRAEVGINSGQLDLAVAGLGLLMQSAKEAQRKAILIQAVLNQPRNIALEAARMLNSEIGSIETCQVCLQCPHEAVSLAAVSWLAQDYEQKSVQNLLRTLADDSPVAIRERAVEALVRNKDNHAFDSVSVLLSSVNPVVSRKQCYKWLSELNDPRSSELLVHLATNAKLDLDNKLHYQTIANFRDKSVATKLLKQLNPENDIADQVAAIRSISGFDQLIEDPEDLRADRSWMQGQHERHGDVLANLMERCLEFNLTKQVVLLIPSARWCLTNEVDRPLSRLVANPEEAIRRKAIEAVSFRAEKREGKVDSLIELIDHRDPMTQFLSAEGLAKAGNDSGIHVLMSAVEMMEDLRLRRRAVLALGHLSDERTMDLLLNLVTQEGHALQEYAAEAIGHLGQSEQGDKIFKILYRLLEQEGSAAARAVVGLRYVNTPTAWNAIRQRCKKNLYNQTRTAAVKQLGYDSSEATQAVLLDLLERSHSDTAFQLAAARRSFGADSIIPDLAFVKGLKGRSSGPPELANPCVDRICELADPQDVFDLVGHCEGDIRSRLANHLIMLDPFPVAQSLESLEKADALVVEIAAHVLGRNGDKKHSKHIGAVLKRWQSKYVDESQRLQLQNVETTTEFAKSGRALKRLVWAGGRVGGLEQPIIDLVCQHPNDLHFGAVRRLAIGALVDGKMSEPMEKQLTELLEDYDPKIRLMASQLLVSQTKFKADDFGESLLADRAAFNHLVETKPEKIKKTLQLAAASTHYQPRVMNELIKSSDVRTLQMVAIDAKSNLNARLGAIEGLAAISDANAEKVLVEIGRDESVDKELRKAAWRGLRRSKRKAK